MRYNYRKIENVIIIIPIINNKNIFKDGFYHKENLINRKSETLELISSLNLFIKKTLNIKINHFDSGKFFNKFKLHELQEHISNLDIDIVIIDFKLSPIQQRNLEIFFNKKVIDRTQVILEIFGARAISKEGKIQVDLASLTFQKTRLVRSWSHLERQRGGAGFLGGPGERQIELDRRILDSKIKSLKKDLRKIIRTRNLQKINRNKSSVIKVSMVGYTNAGKSSLFNKLTNSKVMTKNMPFATLDPTIRLIGSPHFAKRKIILSDTVGFISSLPTELIQSFQSTLDYITESDLILIVHDLSDIEISVKSEIVYNTLLNLGISKSFLNENVINIYNKIDMVKENENIKALHESENSIFTCAFDKKNILELKYKIFDYINKILVK